MKFIAITYFLETLTILDTKNAIMHYLAIEQVSSHSNSADFDVFELCVRQNNKNNSFTIFANFYFEIAVILSKWRLKKSNWNMCKTSGAMHMPDMVKIDAVVFESIRGGGGLSGSPSSYFKRLKYSGSYGVNTGLQNSYWNMPILSMVPKFL